MVMDELVGLVADIYIFHCHFPISNIHFRSSGTFQYWIFMNTSPQTKHLASFFHNFHEMWQAFRLASIVLTMLPSTIARMKQHAIVREFETEFIKSPMMTLKENDTFPATVIGWDRVEDSNKVSLLTMSVEHNRDNLWYIPSLHDKYSTGWKRSIDAGFLNRPFACSIRFFGMGLEKTLQGFTKGGTGYINLKYKSENGKYFGFEKETNETKKLHCYYMTNKHYGSEFIDTPKTLAIVVSCPVTIDSEIGEFAFRKQMVPGHYCRVLAEHKTRVEVHFRPSNFEPPNNLSTIVPDHNEITSSILTNPTAARLQLIRDQYEEDPRAHSVCTVQTFRNPQSGLSLIALTVVLYFRILEMYRWNL